MDETGFPQIIDQVETMNYVSYNLILRIYSKGLFLEEETLTTRTSELMQQYRRFMALHSNKLNKYFCSY